jgi:hypothetical protein
VRPSTCSRPAARASRVFPVPVSLIVTRRCRQERVDKHSCSGAIPGHPPPRRSARGGFLPPGDAREGVWQVASLRARFGKSPPGEQRPRRGTAELARVSSISVVL